jgi:hypothetical protein
MIGLLLIAAYCVLCIFGLRKMYRIDTLRSRPLLRNLTVVTMTATLTVVPVLDELVGKYQFAHLCASNGLQAVNLGRLAGKKVKIEHKDRNPVPGALIPTKQDDVALTDATSGELLATYKDYYAEGGWLVRYTWLSLGASGPMLFPGNGCGWHHEVQLLSSARVSVVD